MNSIPDTIEGYVFHSKPCFLEIHRCIKLWRDYPSFLLATLFRMPVPPIVRVFTSKPQTKNDISIDEISDLNIEKDTEKQLWKVFFISNTGNQLGKKLEFTSIDTANLFVDEAREHLRRLEMMLPNRYICR